MSAESSRAGFAARSPWLLLALFVLGIDQVVKLKVERSLPLHEPVTVIRGFFRLEHVLNPGGVWGLGGGASDSVRAVVFLALPLVIVALAVWYSLQMPAAERLPQAAIALIVGGALGNLVDRVRIEAVIDYFVFFIGKYEWPAFNVADAAICTGVALLALTTLRSREPVPGPQHAADSA